MPMLRVPAVIAWLTADPRHGQIAVLTTLVAYGVAALDFDIGVPQIVATVGTAIAVQRLGDRHRGAPWVPGLKSALISSLSLCLLLRTDTLVVAAAGAAIAVGSKFLLRVGGKHVFNPTNGALAALLLVTGHAWVSAGQWGAGATFAFALASAGLAVVHRSSRSDVTLAFLVTYTALVVARALWLGDPLAVALHRLTSGAFLLFAFFMISDPKTTPDSRAGRVVFGALVALAAAYVHFRLFRPNGFLWALAALSPLVPIIDRLSPAARYAWPVTVPSPPSWRSPMLKKTALFLIALTLAGPLARADAFCGFYVARADTTLFNKASQVVLVRDGDRTVITMANDFRGDPREFAMVIPVPTAIARDQIRVVDAALLQHLDAYTAPRLVEYFDADPCARYDRWRTLEAPFPAAAASLAGSARDERRARALGVTIEARHTVGEYDILILSAVQSTGLETWLRDSGYRVPRGASEVLGSYIRQRMRFFVAKVNLAEQAKAGFTSLRPIQVAYESPKFMLPIRLGMVNADGPQELFVYALTRTGRVESTNYRTVRLRTDVEIPPYVKDPAVFGRMYRAMFDRHVAEARMSAVFQEYAWDMAWCDPCAADPFTADELGRLGVFWAEPAPAQPWSARAPGGAPNVFVTRLHVRYDREHFPDDLVFQATGDRTNFQGRYVLRHAWTGPLTCAAGDAYRRELAMRQEREAQTLASLTGWPVDAIRRRETPAAEGGRAAAPAPPPPPEPLAWWRKFWP
jgi:hypothetical protein